MYHHIDWCYVIIYMFVAHAYSVVFVLLSYWWSKPCACWATPLYLLKSVARHHKTVSGKIFATYCIRLRSGMYLYGQQGTNDQLTTCHLVIFSDFSFPVLWWARPTRASALDMYMVLKLSSSGESCWRASHLIGWSMIKRSLKHWCLQLFIGAALYTHALLFCVLTCAILFISVKCISFFTHITYSNCCEEKAETCWEWMAYWAPI